MVKSYTQTENVYVKQSYFVIFIGFVLRFLLGPSLHSQTVRLFCNHPPEINTPFDRNVYHELEWRCPTGMRSDLTDVHAEVEMVCTGSFNYFFTIDERLVCKNCVYFWLSLCHVLFCKWAIRIEIFLMMINSAVYLAKIN